MSENNEGKNKIDPVPSAEEPINSAMDHQRYAVQLNHIQNYIDKR